VGIAAVTADRESWTAYAEREGLIREDPAGNYPHNTTGPIEGGSKYHAVPVHVDGIRFASKVEAARYLELKLLEKTGLIADLERQPVFPLHIVEIWRSGAPLVIFHAGRYTADFRYTDLGVYALGEIVVEDVKSEATKTTAYRLRKTMAEHIHGIHVREIQR
jgi:hypothetical protein